MAPRSIGQSQQNIVPVPAALSCGRCSSRTFHAQMAEGNFLVLVCASCTDPLLFEVRGFCEFANPRHYVIEANITPSQAAKQKRGER
jgi:hypothetical protein